MARIAIISDIKANYHALWAVMEDAIHTERCSEVVCLGDVIGYNAYPAECLDYIRQLNCPVVKGNHEEEAIAPSSAAGMDEDARRAMDWTRRQLGEERLLWLSRLQYQRMVSPAGASTATFTMVHATLSHPKGWGYIVGERDASSNFQRQFSSLCFHGHTCVPKTFIWDGHHAVEDDETAHALAKDAYAEVNLHPGLKYCINVGSVGQPRDGDPRSCYGIYDTDPGTVILKRVAYDIEGAQQAIFDVGLPASIAERLSRGC